MNEDDAEFDRQCKEAANKVVEVLRLYPKDVAYCTMLGTFASMIKTFGIPREAVDHGLDTALGQITGKVEEVVTTTRCPACNGAGRVPVDMKPWPYTHAWCSVCGGSGRVEAAAEKGRGTDAKH